MWKKFIKMDSLVDIIDILNLLGLEFYICSFERVCMKFLFSYVVICRVEIFKDDFLNIIR